MPTLTPPMPPPPPRSLQSIDPGQQFTWEHSNLEVNKPKNRYANVIAYDHSRVILQPIEGSMRGPRLHHALARSPGSPQAPRLLSASGQGQYGQARGQVGN